VVKPICYERRKFPQRGRGDQAIETGGRQNEEREIAGVGKLADSKKWLDNRVTGRGWEEHR